MPLYIVVHTVGGYAPEDARIPEGVAAFTDPRVADAVARLAGPDARVCSIELDSIPAGYRCRAQELGLELPDNPAQGMPR